MPIRALHLSGTENLCLFPELPGMCIVQNRIWNARQRSTDNIPGRIPNSGAAAIIAVITVYGSQCRFQTISSTKKQTDRAHETISTVNVTSVP